MTLNISNVTAWAPGIEDNENNWTDWANNRNSLKIEESTEAPKLEYTSPLFRRRLSQITKMTVHVVHNLLEKSKISTNTKIVYTSLRGEINRQFNIAKTLIEDEVILPAPFSLSVFNTPISSATLAFGLKGGYSVIFPSKNNFADAFKTAVAPVLAGTEKEIIFVYSEELVPEDYASIRPKEDVPLAFACIISSETKDNCISLNDFSNVPESPVEFLKYLLK